MASEIRVNSINARSGIGTVAINDGGINVAGIVTAAAFVGNGLGITNIGGIKNIVRGIETVSKFHTTNWEETGLEATITPSTSSSKVIIVVNQPVYCRKDTGGGVKICKNGVELYKPADISLIVTTTDENSFTCQIANIMYVDNLTTNSTVTYSTQAKASRYIPGENKIFYTNSGHLNSSALSQMYLIEVV